MARAFTQLTPIAWLSSTPAASHPLSYAYDNNSTTEFWTNTNSWYLGCQYARKVKPVTWYLKPAADSANYPSPTSFRLQSSDDGVNWTTVQTITGLTQDPASAGSLVVSQLFSASLVPAYYWRIYYPSTGNLGYLGVGTFLFFVEPDDAFGPNLCDFTQTAYDHISGGTYSGWNDSNPFNNYNWYNAWYSSQRGTVANLAWLGYYFGTGRKVHIRRIELMTSQVASYNVANFKVQYSDDGTAWTDVASFTNGATNIVSQKLKSLDLPATGPHNRWRLLATSNLTTGNYWGIYHLQMRELRDYSTVIS